MGVQIEIHLGCTQTNISVKTLLLQAAPPSTSLPANCPPQNPCKCSSVVAGCSACIMPLFGELNGELYLARVTDLLHLQHYCASTNCIVAWQPFCAKVRPFKGLEVDMGESVPSLLSAIVCVCWSAHWWKRSACRSDGKSELWVVTRLVDLMLDWHRMACESLCTALLNQYNGDL